MSTDLTNAISRRSFGLGMFGLAGSLVVLAGCGDEGGAGSPGGGSEDKGTAAYVNKGMNYFFFVVQNEAIKRKSEELGYTFQTTDAKFDSSTQYNHWNSFLIQKPAFLIADPIDSEGLAPLAQKAKTQKIPVGIIDTPLTKGVVDFTIAFDNYRGGEMAAEKIVELLEKRYGKPQGKVLNGYGALSSSAWRARKEGFEAVLAKYPAITLISRPTEGDEAKARSIAQATLSEHADLDAAHAPSDSITRGIITTLKAQGRALPKDDPKHVILTSIDGEPQSLKWIADGILDAEVSQDPVAYGEICVEMLTQYTAAGKDIPLGQYENEKYFWEKAPVEETENGPSCVIPPYYIDESNVDDERQWGNVVIQKWGLSQS
jgi:simple sugar transport system substrate-binding protein